MASTATSRLRLNKQGTYDNPETWGIELNNGMIDMVDDAHGGFSATISGDVSLTVENYTADQARKMFMILDGAGGFTITVPAVDKMYYVVNNCAADVTVKPLAGTGAVIRAGMAMWWYCDGTNGFVFDPTLDQILPPAADLDLDGQKLINVGAPVDPDDAATKDYIDTLAASSDLGTVAAIAAQIVTVAGIEDGTVATEAVTDVAAIAAAIVEVAGVAPSVAQLADMFVGGSATDPTTRLDGSPLQAGDYYLNTAGTPTVRIYSGSAWIPIETVALASKAQAEAGANNATVMTPLRVKEARSGAVGVEVFTTSGIFMKKDIAAVYLVEVIGGGGGGGGGASALTGGDGGATSFGALAIATGGRGGAAGNNALGGIGGAGGGDGGAAITTNSARDSSLGGGGGAAFRNGSGTYPGGSGRYGGNGGTGSTSAPSYTAATNGTAPGGGGGGGIDPSSTLSNRGAGGGGGGGVSCLIPASAMPSSVSVTIGAAGTPASSGAGAGARGEVRVYWW